MVLFYPVLLWSALSETLNSLLSKRTKSCHVRTAERAAAVQAVGKQPQSAEHMTKASSPHWPGLGKEGWISSYLWLLTEDAGPLDGSMKGCLPLPFPIEWEHKGVHIPLFSEVVALQLARGQDTWRHTALWKMPCSFQNKHQELCWSRNLAEWGCHVPDTMSSTWFLWGASANLCILRSVLQAPSFPGLPFFLQQDVSMPYFTLVWDFCIKC